LVKKTRVEKLLEKLNKSSVDNDKEFLECLIDLDIRLKKLESLESRSRKPENQENQNV